MHFQAILLNIEFLHKNLITLQYYGLGKENQNENTQVHQPTPQHLQSIRTLIQNQ